MLKEYDGSEVSQCEALWNIARELSRKNDLLEIEILLKTAETLNVVGQSAVGIGSARIFEKKAANWKLADELMTMVYDKAAKLAETT